MGQTKQAASPYQIAAWQAVIGRDGAVLLSLAIIIRIYMSIIFASMDFQSFLMLIAAEFFWIEFPTGNMSPSRNPISAAPGHWFLFF